MKADVACMLTRLKCCIETIENEKKIKFFVLMVIMNSSNFFIVSMLLWLVSMQCLHSWIAKSLLYPRNFSLFIFQSSSIYLIIKTTPMITSIVLLSSKIR